MKRDKCRNRVLMKTKIALSKFQKQNNVNDPREENKDLVNANRPE